MLPVFRTNGYAAHATGAGPPDLGPRGRATEQSKPKGIWSSSRLRQPAFGPKVRTVRINAPRHGARDFTTGCPGSGSLDVGSGELIEAIWGQASSGGVAPVKPGCATDPESLSCSRVFFGLKAFRTTCTEPATYRPSVPASIPEKCPLRPEKLPQNCCTRERVMETQ